MAVWDVVSLGRCAHDMLATIPHWPGPDEKMETSAFTRQCGGLVATALAAVARLGARSAMISKTGDDDAGAFVRRALEDGGVDVTHLAVERDATTLSSLVLVAPTCGTRAIFWHPGTVAHLEPENLPRELLSQTRVLHLDHFYVDAAIVAARIARESGALVILDAEREVEGLDELCRTSDVLIFPDEFARAWTGDDDAESAARALRARFGSVAVVTTGAAGSWCVDGSRAFHTPAYRVRVTDPTGAGDAFHGAGRGRARLGMAHRAGATAGERGWWAGLPRAGRSVEPADFDRGGNPSSRARCRGASLRQEKTVPLRRGEDE